jgi:hypothetical protein
MGVEDEAEKQLNPHMPIFEPKGYEELPVIQQEDELDVEDIPFKKS